ncbi:type 1 fimbrial protein [Serratia marcescens]|nr:type 1 fimbrial protein [Serratia marcescens]
MIKETILLVLLMPLLFFGNEALATCQLDRSGTLPNPLNLAIPLQSSNLTVGEDLPNGSVIYRSYYNPQLGGNVKISCSEKASGDYNVTHEYARVPMPLSSWSGTPYGGKVYETNIPGIGVVISRSLTSIPPIVSGVAGKCSGSDNCSVGNIFFDWDISLIKTGRVSPGTLNGSALPCVKVTFGQNNGSSTEVINACYSGGINIVSKTCKTPDVDVYLGKYDVADFRGKGSSTAWKDSSIYLSECPVFYGLLNDGRNTNWSNTGSASVGQYTRNTLSLKLTPNTPIVDNNNGILSIKEDAKGTSAVGVGIQLSYGTGSPLEAVNFLQSKSYEMENGSSGNIKLPLAARYIQVSDEVKPGVANGAVTFMINYY